MEAVASISGSPGEESGSRALLDAIGKDQIHLARFILDALEDRIVESRGEGARTPLMCSVLLPVPGPRVRFMRLLLERGARVNSRDGAGRTPLSFACERGFLDAVKLLVQHNADPELADLWGNTPLLYAAASGHGEVLEFLVRAFKRLGLDIERSNKVGNSARQVARFLGHRHCVLALQGPAPRKGTGGAELPPCQEAAQLRGRAATVRTRLESMGSIEEEDRDQDRDRPLPQTPQPSQSRLRSRSVQYSSHRDPSGGLLPPLTHASDICPLRAPAPYSPRPVKGAASPWGASATSTLGVLLTPLSPYAKGGVAGAAAPQCRGTPGLPRFNESYYQKRCSLPTSTVSPSPPDKPSRSAKAVPGASSATFAILGNRLFRRFTFPDFRKPSKGQGGANPASREGDRGMPRSETFPLSSNHPQISNKPSIDSISGVQCEFDFQHQDSS